MTSLDLEHQREMLRRVEAGEFGEKFSLGSVVRKDEPGPSDVHVDTPSWPKRRKRKRRLPKSNIRVVRKAKLARGTLPVGNAERERAYQHALQGAFARLEAPSDEVLARALRNKPDIYINALGLATFTKALDEALMAQYLIAVRDEGVARMGDTPLAKAEARLVFDFRTPLVMRWIRSRTAELVKAVTDDIKASIRAVIGRMYTEGIHPTDAIPLVRAALGDHALFPQWAQAVLNYGLRLTEQGLGPEQVRELTTAYHERLADARAAMIARTEIIAAQNEGRTEAWSQMVDAGMLDAKTIAKQWDASHEGVCPQCDLLDGVVVGLTQLFPSGTPRPPAHPNCRCVVLLVERNP